jgi:cytochrome b subunit of formate dehydrogenase
MILRLAALIVALAFLAIPGLSQTAECAACHDQAAKVAASTHAKVACAECHPRHETFPHPENIPKKNCAACHAMQAADHAGSVHGIERQRGNEAAPDCAVCHGVAHETASARTAEFRKSVPDTCGMCHADIAAEFKASVHGQAVAGGIIQAPVCTDCHGEHRILRPKESMSSVNPAHLRETCARCHADVRLSRRLNLPADRVTSFDASFHGLAAKAGSQTVANCASCHGFHRILASTDPASTIHPANLPKTCGRCHPGAGRRFALGTVHLAEGGSEPLGVRMVRAFYLFVIPLTIGLMLLHQGGDWARKLRRLRLKPLEQVELVAVEEVRMHPWERRQHLVLVISFVVLVWTGFALKYPERLWAWPLVKMEAALSIRGFLHRLAGGVLIGASIFHVAALIASRRLREHWRSLLPRAGDTRQAVQGFAYNLGLRKTRPVLSPHCYIEKAEYWAVVWGTAVMALTGVMLWANNFMMRLLPKSWLDFATTVHFYEAVLATLAIFVWHFYTVIFDPDVYPMDTAWLTGRTVRRRPAEHSSDAGATGDDGQIP